MNKVKRIIGLMAFTLMILSLPAIASAQWRNDDDDYNRNGRYGNGQYGGWGNGGYGNGQYGGYGNLSSTIRDLKRKSSQFERQMDRSLDRSRYDGTDREDRIMDTVRDFDNAVDQLNSGRNRQNNGEIRRVLDLGRQVDRQMARLRLNGNLSQLWNSIQYDLNTLGNAYGYNNNRGRRNGGWGNGRNNGNNNLPNWWPF
ncbi:MAG: hypothetical protein IPM59_00165 [Chloracidobacterium sp.]|nr:hypothetical protein [Chloracidobacterium sp.]